MKHILLLFLSFFVLVVWGQQVEQFKLWPDKPEAGEAEIFVYHPAKGGKAAPAVLICPGGGYRGLAMNHEGHDMAKWYASNGFVAVVLKYRMPEGVHTIPLSDDDQTVPPLNSILYYTALNEHHIPASLYMFPSGGHGWGFRYDFTYYQEVKDLIQKWLTYIKITD